MSHLNFLLSALNREHHQIYYTPLAHYLKSIEAAVMFAELVQRHQYHQNREELTQLEGKGGGWFYHTYDNIVARTAITRRGYDNTLKLLKKFNLIETALCGLPCRKYFRINLNGLEEFSKNLSSLHKVYEQEGARCTNRKVHGVRTHSLYIEEPKEEPKEEREGGEPPQTPTPSPIFLPKKAKKEEKAPCQMTKFGEYVSLKPGEYETLCASIGKTGVDDLIESINNWVPNNKSYSDYAAAIRTWYKKDLKLGKSPSLQDQVTKEKFLKSQVDTNKSWFMKKYARIPLSEYISVSDDYITFYRRSYGHSDHKSEIVRFSSNAFKEQIISELRKLNIDIKDFEGG